MQQVKQPTTPIRIKAMARLATTEEERQSILSSASTQLIAAPRTDPGIPVVESDRVVHIGSIVPQLVSLTPMAQRIVVDGYRMAYLHRRVVANSTTYEIVDIFASPDLTCVGKIYAKLHKLGKVEEKTSGQH